MGELCGQGQVREPVPQGKYSFIYALIFMRMSNLLNWDLK